MNMFVKLVAAFILGLSLLLTGACTSQSFTSSRAQQYSAWRGDVKVLKQLPVAGSYVLIGVVRIEGVNLTSDESMYDSMKTQAARRGANAVVPQAKIRSQIISSGGTRRILAAYAIRLRKQ